MDNNTYIVYCNPNFLLPTIEFIISLCLGSLPDGNVGEAGIMKAH